MKRIVQLPVAIGLLLGMVIMASAHEPVVVKYYGGNGEPVISDGTFDSSVPTPESVLGFELGDRPARHAQVLQYFKELATASPKVELFKMGQTYEGRPLVYAAISSAANIARLNQIKENLARIADPRTLSRSDLKSVIKDTPASVWLAYSIHGDEISGVDASMAVAYRLAAGTDALITTLLSETIVLIDPCENPDGRERYLAQMESYATAVPSSDGQSIQKNGFWPWGRGDHYLFDMNRDWFAEELIESQARIAAIVPWHPQVFVDAHEMGKYDTYLFSPPRAPFNPQLTMKVRNWWDRFAEDQARAFDTFGWPYYTRDWNEEWYPGYGSSWPLFMGSVGILYEQAGVSGYKVSQHDGTVLSYSEAVAHQYVSSIANVTTAANNRAELLNDYYDHADRAIKEFGGGPARAFLIKPDANIDRLDHLVTTLRRQNIEVQVATKSFSAKARGYFDSEETSQEMPAGTIIIPTNQPTGFLIQTILSFDLRMSDEFLAVERRELLKHRDSKLYEVTGWSLLPAYGVDAFEASNTVKVASRPWNQDVVSGRVEGTNPLQGYMFDVSSDRGLRAMCQLWDRGLTLFASNKALDVQGLDFPRGSIFMPKQSNPSDYGEIIADVATATGVEFVGINSGKGAAGPDLGGNELRLLRQPKVAIMAGFPVSPTSLAAVWHMCDQKLGLAASLIEASRLQRIDLSIYNVLILPHTWGSLSNIISNSTAERIMNWVRGGGTLITLDGATAYASDSSNGISSVRSRRDVLGELADYEKAAAQEIDAEHPDISDLKIWDYSESAETEDDEKSGSTPSKEELEKQDEFARIFSPHGVIMKVNLDQEHWLTSGMGESIPVMFYSSRAYMAKFPAVRTVGRFAPADEIRVSGLLWPEARLRLANTSYCTRERAGRGQIIMFAHEPNFRAYFRGSERLISNAVLYGPGMGASWTPEW